MEQFQILPISKLFESPFNPRQTYSEKKMAELFESIKAKGILTPLIVRPAKKIFTVLQSKINDLWYVVNEHDVRVSPGAETQVKAEEEAKTLNAKDGNDGRFEIGAGHRRYRAAKEAGLTEVPVNIREMSDSDFLELLTIENLQREDLQPLEEAQGYRALMEKSKYDVPAIAAKVGKSESYIYQRLKLLELIPEVQKQLIEEKITAGHAILIARLQPDQQKEAFKECFYAYGGRRNEALSVRELTEWIYQNIHLDLNKTSFPKKDPDLVPGAGPCTTCPKRTGFAPALFPDIQKKDICTDPKCFHAKVAAYIAQWTEKQSQDTDQPPLRLSRAWGGRMKKLPDDPNKPIPRDLYHEIEGKKDRCSSVRDAIMVDGHEQGQVKQVCVDPKCEKHHGRQNYSSPESQKWKAEQKARQEKEKLEETIRLRIIDAILPTAGDLSKNDLAFIAFELFDELWDEHRKKLLARHEIKPVKIQYGWDQMAPMKKHLESCSMVDLGRLLMEMALIRHRESHPRYRGRKGDPLLETAKRYKVDPKKIEEEVKAEAKEKAAAKKKKTEKQGKQPAKTKKTGKKAEKPKSGVCRVCGCTHETPCINPVTDEPCSWTDKTKTLCTACQRMEKTEEAQRRVQTSAKKKRK